LATSAQIINLDNATRFDYPMVSSDHNFRAPDLSGKNFSGGPNIKGYDKNCRIIKRKFKMQQNL